ncbi:MAG: hypothetical protein P4K83_03680 [Terracidiphilus sp.]|nr:hypothetical protein [Terracidiphilus sp.]
MTKNKNVMFRVQDPMGNHVVLYEQTWLNHIVPKHGPQYGEELPDLKDIREAIQKPDQMRRSSHPEIGQDTCIFEKIVGDSGHLLRTPVFYSDLPSGETYDLGRGKGHATTAYFPDPGSQSQNVGEVFWANPNLQKGDEK